MRKSRFSQEQIAGILAEARAGVPTLELCRRHNLSAKTFYGWRRRYGGMDGAEVRRTKELEEKLSRLKRVVARQAVELEAARAIIRGKY